MNRFRLRTRTWCYSWAFSAFWALSSWYGPGAAFATAPDSPDQLTPPSQSRTAVSDQRILFWQAKVASDPDFWGSYNQLAAAYAQKARETGDIEYFELAEKSLRESLKLESTHVDAAPAFTQLATVHLAEHRFAEAAADAAKAIALRPGDLAAYTYAGDAQLELGNYAESQKFYSQLVAPSDGMPHAGIKFLASSHGAGLSWVTGNTRRATEELKDAVELARKLHLPEENTAWTEFMLGEQYLQMGDLVSAEKEEIDSLADFPTYHRALAAMARIRASQSRFHDAIALYERAIAIIPLPVYLAALGDLYAVTGDKVNAEKQYSIVEFIGKLNAINQQVYNRELALFYADHDRKLPEALRLSRKEMECRHDIYTLDALAWALFKNGEAQDARDEMEQALRLGTRDALLEYHAGLIYAAAGDKANAALHLEQALQINPHFHVIFAAHAAEMLAHLGGTANPVTATQVEARDVDQK